MFREIAELETSIDKLLETGRQQNRLIADLRQQIRRQAETIFRMELRERELVRVIQDRDVPHESGN